MTEITHLTCEYKTNPLGIDVPRPRLSWRMETARDGARQTAYQIVTDDWDSGKVDSDQSVQIAYDGPKLTSKQRVGWRVRVWDETGGMTESEDASWEMGLLEKSDWQAAWIGASLVGGPRTSVPAPFLRRSFTLDKPVKSARLYATALGLYETHLNGAKVGDDWLTPGWTDYTKRVQYQVYDVTANLTQGENVLGAILGDGWYCGCVEWRGRQRYGDRPQFLAQLVVTFDDGATQTIVTDGEWKTAIGPILANDLLMGESIDARLEMPGWDAPNFDETRWLPVETFPASLAALVAMPGPPVRATEELTPVGEPVHGIYDLGINMVGTVRVKVRGKAGQTIRLRYAEVLKDGPAASLPGGGIYLDNLRSAAQTDFYTLKGDPDGETFAPRFTFHGFRYAEINGFDNPPEILSIVGVVLHSDTPKTGDFECSEPLLNQLQKNIDWGQRGNFVDIPTDCPQRDERLGWTGDAQAFIRTAAFNRDVASFFTKWQQDLADAQGPRGEFPSVAPNTAVVPGDGGPAWADAGVICPWTIYLCFGDRQLLAEHYDSMARFLSYLESTAMGFLRCADAYSDWKGYGDWLALDGSGKTDGGSPRDLLGTAFFAHDAELMSKIARLLGKDDDAARYEMLFQNVKNAFCQRFVAPSGLIIGGTQTAYVLALHFDLLPEELRPAAADALVRDIKSRGNKLSTGFVGSPYLPHVLAEHGKLDTAYALLHQTGWPSWLYAVTQGATTIWERWDGWTKENGFQDAGMNSFNHYAYGAIGAWLYQTVAGIDADEAKPGYKHVKMAPKPGGKLTSARASLETQYGTIESAWTLTDGKFEWNVVIPPNVTATVQLPDASAPQEISAGRHQFSATLSL